MSTAASPGDRRPESAAAHTKAAEAATPRPVEFVCEQDVQEAIKQGRKIYISAKTIITPSARDGRSPRVFVVARAIECRMQPYVYFRTTDGTQPDGRSLNIGI
jgi:hypothetical protein